MNAPGAGAVMEAAAAVACRGGGVLARARPGHRARRHGVSAGPVARRRFLVVASLGETPSAPLRSAVAVAQEVICSEILVPVPRGGGGDEDVASTAIPPSPDVNLPSQDHVKTVRVKFVLEKRCAFGQRFLVVGDDPALGLWDPAKATALDWSEGHVWTAKTDLPANRLVEFKFLLQDPSGHVRWQHGRNRTLHITSNALVVYEDWDDAKRQEVSEEVSYLSIGAGEAVFAGANGVLLANEGWIDDDQETYSYKGFTHAEKSPSSAAEASLHAETMGVNGANRPEKDEKNPEELRGGANMAAQNGGLSSTGINGDAIVLYKEAAPVGNRPASMFENDMVWIREALQGLLQNLGFHVGTTKNIKKY